MIVARLSEPDTGRYELLERAHALRSDDRARTARPQAVGQEHGGRLAQPVEARLVARVLERHHEHARRGRRGAARALGRSARRRHVAMLHAARAGQQRAR